jgi:hypothetical protein
MLGLQGLGQNAKFGGQTSRNLKITDLTGAHLFSQGQRSPTGHPGCIDSTREAVPLGGLVSSHNDTCPRVRVLPAPGLASQLRQGREGWQAAESPGEAIASGGRVSSSGNLESQMSGAYNHLVSSIRPGIGGMLLRCPPLLLSLTSRAQLSCISLTSGATPFP